MIGWDASPLHLQFHSTPCFLVTLFFCGSGCQASLQMNYKRSCCPHHITFVRQLDLCNITLDFSPHLHHNRPRIYSRDINSTPAVGTVLPNPYQWTHFYYHIGCTVVSSALIDLLTKRIVGDELCFHPV